MRPVSTNLTIYNNRQIKTDKEIYEENRTIQINNETYSIGDLVSFYKSEFARVKIIGTIQSINEKSLHVKTQLFFNGINEFYLNVAEVRKYDPTSNRK